MRFFFHEVVFADIVGAAYSAPTFRLQDCPFESIL
jgi:hypothetical protein